MGLIMMRDEHSSKKYFLRPTYTDETKKDEQNGIVWVDKNFEIKIEDKNSKYFQIQSDLAKSFYKQYYLKDETKPSILYI